MIKTILELLFPKSCVGCKKYGTFLCLECTQQITQSPLVCPFCERSSIGGVTHPICQRKYGLNGLWFLGTYEDPLKQAIQKLKYKFITELAETLVNTTLVYWATHQPFIFDQIKKSQGQNWIITSVPLHKKRQNWRGFNQSALLAKLFVEKLGLNYQELLIRIRNTKPQMKLKGPDRKTNIKNAFSLNTKDIIRNTNVILIDDVWTTGSTLRECCYVLKRSGAKTVWALTLAR